MGMAPITIRGVVQPDGTLELDEKINLPPGQVRVTLIPWPDLPPDDPFWTLMQGIWSGQQARGHVPRCAEEVEADRRRMAEEWDQRMAEIARIQAEAALHAPRSFGLRIE